MVMFLFACACKVLKIADNIILRGIRVPVWRLTQLYPQIECEIERPCAQIPQFAHAHDGPTISDRTTVSEEIVLQSPSVPQCPTCIWPPPPQLPYPQIEATQRVGLQVQNI